MKASRLFCPTLITPKNAIVKNTDISSKSQRLMLELGLLKPATNGTFQIMPLGQRVVDKCIALAEQNMQTVGGQKITLPILTPTSLWKRTGRLDGDITEFYMLRDRHGKEFLMSPTYEEAITAMIASTAPISYRQLPLRLYQVGPKFRDELKTRYGLMRAKEFIMKDMYAFDVSEHNARETYSQLNEAYTNFFRQLEVPFVKVNADTGAMGGSMSHEYHYISPVGEDVLYECKSCQFACNIEISGELSHCPSCKSTNITKVRGIEVGHTFLLGDKYSKPLGATFLNECGKPNPLIMSCYGLGITRIIAAALEVLSSENKLQWPKLLAPFDVCVIGPKQGSREQTIGDSIEKNVLQALIKIVGVQGIFHDDRKYLTIGKRLMEAKRMGYPLIVVVGGKSIDSIPKLELHNNIQCYEIELREIIDHVSNFKNLKTDLFGLSPRSKSMQFKDVNTKHEEVAVKEIDNLK